MEHFLSVCFFENVGMSPRELGAVEQVLFKEDGAKERMISWMRGGESWEQVIAIVAARTRINERYVRSKFVQGCRSMHFSMSDLPIQILRLKILGYGVHIATDNMDSFNLFTVPALKIREILILCLILMIWVV